MADNYLEKKMEDYRKGNHSKPAVAHAKRTAPHTMFDVEFDCAYVILESLIYADDILASILKIIPKAAIAHTAAREGAQIAQRTGALFIPLKKWDNEAIDGALNFAVNRWSDRCLIITDSREALGIARHQKSFRTVFLSYNNVTGISQPLCEDYEPDAITINGIPSADTAATQPTAAAKRLAEALQLCATRQAAALRTITLRP